MNATNTQNSAGLVETRQAKIPVPAGGLKLENGLLPELTVAYETYGALSPAKDNVIFICHALSGDAHVAGYHNDPNKTVGWWDEMVGPGKGIDTDHYFVVCANILGGCKGTTGPSSINPKTGKPYGSAFPKITISDIVDVNKLLLKHLGIERLAAVIGGSLGGMQALEWSIRYPEMIARCICVATATSLSTQALAFDIVGRDAITSDPDWQNGDYYGTGRSPSRGLSHARKIGHITYLSPEMMTQKFGRERHSNGNVKMFETNFQVESYLDHQGEKFVDRFDANSYLHITRAIDEYDLVEKHGSLEKAFEVIKAKALIVALSSDWLFPPEQSVDLANALLRAGKQVSYCNLQAPHGHDAFLIDIKHLSEIMRAFLPWVGTTRRPSKQPCDDNCKRECHNIVKMIRHDTRVLDLGCGDCTLLSMLAEQRRIAGIGVDIDIHHVIEAIDSGHDIFQADIDAGLAMIPDGTYDYAILSETLQVVRNPKFVLREMLRVAKQGVVIFPNFGKWSHLISLWLTGRMPKGDSLPFEWYETPNIHLFTLKDFIDLCRQDDIKITNMVCTSTCWFGKLLLKLGLHNLGADRVLVQISRNNPDK